MSRIAAVVLAAGAATRFGSPKQRLLLPRVLDRLAASPVDEVVVVEGAYGLRAESTRASVRLVHCADWERGPGASLRCGLSALGEDVEAALVIMADGPELAPEAVARVIQSWRDEGGDVVAASYGGQRATRFSPPAPCGATCRTRACASSSRGSSPATTSARPATWTRRRTTGSWRGLAPKVPDPSERPTTDRSADLTRC